MDELPFETEGSPRLHELTFVVVDLETTGGSAATEAITEIGAVKVRGGEVIGEFATLVDPERGLPPFITVLTGITEAMLLGAPRVAEVIPSFLSWAHGCVLVAHNAPFDVGFLKAAAARLGLAWPTFPVVDTARLARRALTREEAPSCKLSALATLFHSPVTPSHRALADAQATVHVLHGLMERVGNLGVHTLAELTAYSRHVPPEVRRKRHLADGLPHAPGVYLFRDGQGRALYIGTSRDVRTRVRSYFTAAETRRRMAEMVVVAERVDVVVCATALEAQVRELRLIASEQPRYNRRSRFPAKSSWLTLSKETFPRFVVSRLPRGDGPWVGPFTSARSSRLALDVLHDTLRVRQCTQRLPRTPSGRGCVLAELDRCGAPCTGAESAEAYAEHVQVARHVLGDDPAPLVEAVTQRVTRLAAAHRFEDAAVHRDRLRAFVRAAATAQQHASLVELEELVAARPADGGGWELHVLRRGRLAGATVVPRGADPYPYLDALRATAGPRPGGDGPAPAALPEETAVLLRWLGGPGVRLVAASTPWASPARGAAGHRGWLGGEETGPVLPAFSPS